MLTFATQRVSIGFTPIYKPITLKSSRMSSNKNRLSQRVMAMEESATIKMAQLGRELAAKGHKVINLSLGEPDFDTPVHIKEAAKAALDAGYTKYSPVPGFLELRQAICEKFERDNGLSFKPNQIVVSCGAKQTIANLALCLLDDGDEAIILSPYWVSYAEIIRMAGGIPIEVHAGIEHDFKISPHQLEMAITEKTKFLLFSSPCNPTGSVYSEAELRALATVMARYPEIMIISDEIYEYINFTNSHFSIGSIESVREQTVTVNGFAKGFAMTGWRLGYMGGPDWLAAACAKIQGQFTSGASSFSQIAAITALKSDMTPTRQMAEAFKRRRDLVIGLLSEIDGFILNHPEGAFYVFPNISAYFGKSYQGQAIKNGDDFCMFLLNEAKVSTVSGDSFGAPDCFRLSYAASDEDLIEAVRRIKAAVEQLS